jgi:predicted HD phosphohydrolase
MVLDVPDDVTSAAAQRAEREGHSLPAVTAALLRDYAAGRTWLNIPPVPVPASVASAAHRARLLIEGGL